MNEKEKKEARKKELTTSIGKFCDLHLDNELFEYTLELLDRLSRKRTLSILNGKIENWASAIIYVIARLNFLFDPQAPLYITADTICDFFGTKKSTAGNKATEIEKACKINVGEEGLCYPEISDALTMIQLPNGMLITKQMAREMGLI